jgi:hypothetical protein
VSQEEPRFAYLILSHDRPRQVESLVDRIRVLSPSAQIVVHHDLRAEDVPWNGSPPERVSMVERSMVHWGDWSILDATLRVTKFAYESLEADWFVLISGVDRPVVDLQAWEHSMQSAGVDLLTKILPATKRARFGHRPNGNESAYVRAMYRWHRIPAPKSDSANKAMHRLSSLAKYCQPLVTLEYAFHRDSWFIGHPRLKRSLPPKWSVGWGPQWMAFNRKAAGTALKVEDSVIEHFRHTYVPDQSYLHTVFTNAPDLQRKHALLSYVPWKMAQQRNGEIWIHDEDFPDIVKSKAAFARKFDLNGDSEIVDQIDAMIESSGGRALQKGERLTR